MADITILILGFKKEGKINFGYGNYNIVVIEQIVGFKILTYY